MGCIPFCFKLRASVIARVTFLCLVMLDESFLLVVGWILVSLVIRVEEEGLAKHFEVGRYALDLT